MQSTAQERSGGHRSLLRQAFQILPQPLRRTVHRVAAPFRTNAVLVRQLQAAVAELHTAVREREETNKACERRIGELEGCMRACAAAIMDRETTTEERERRIAELEDRLRTYDAAACSETVSSAHRAHLSAKIRAALPSIEGWCTERKALWLVDLIAANGCSRVLEIGIFGGKSLIPMAMAVKEHAPGGKVYGVEAWSNAVAVETATGAVNDAWWRAVDMQAIKAGFLRNLQVNALTDVVDVLEMSSDRAFTHLTSVDTDAFDLIHVDGSHSEIQALRDVQAWSSLLRPGGILVLDDIGWPSVQPARARMRSTHDVIEEVFESERVAYGAYRRRT